MLLLVSKNGHAVILSVVVGGGSGSINEDKGRVDLDIVSVGVVHQGVVMDGDENLRVDGER